MEVYDHEQEEVTEAASGAQLWRLNELGLLTEALVEQAQQEGTSFVVERHEEGRPIVSRAAASRVLTHAKQTGRWKGVILS